MHVRPRLRRLPGKTAFWRVILSLMPFRAVRNQLRLIRYYSATRPYNQWSRALDIALAVALKDNRAFCKYVCPIPVLQKVGARFALWRMRIAPDKCIDCGLCEKHCPMNIKLMDYKEAGQRILSTECILCHTCVNVCPTLAVSSSTDQFDIVKEEHLRYRGEYGTSSDCWRGAERIFP